MPENTDKEETKGQAVPSSDDQDVSDAIASDDDLQGHSLEEGEGEQNAFVNLGCSS